MTTAGRRARDGRPRESVGGVGAMRDAHGVGQRLASLGDVAGLRPLRTVDDLELHGLSLLQRPEPGTLNGGEVHEHVTPRFALDEPVTLGVVEPLDLARDAFHGADLTLLRRRHGPAEGTP